MTDKAPVPAQAKVVIIGVGIIGCSTVYHLAKMGCNEVVLVEKGKPTSGSSFHAAGLVGQLRTNANITQLLGYSIELYKTLEQETGLATGWKMNGGLRLAALVPKPRVNLTRFHGVFAPNSWVIMVSNP